MTWGQQIATALTGGALVILGAGLALLIRRR